MLLCLCLLTSGCAEPDTSYFPLAEGYSWRYHMKLTTMAGTERQKYYVSSLAPRTIDNVTTYIHRSLTGTQILFRHTGTGINRIAYLIPDGPLLKSVEDELLLLPTDLQVGTEWDSVVQTQTLKKYTPQAIQMKAKIPVKSRIESIGDVVKVPAGKFQDCIRIHTNGFAFHRGSHHIGRTLVEVDEIKWYAPGVGLVKSVLVETTTSDALSRGELIMELESFSQS